jgi:fatty acid desaturase
LRDLILRCIFHAFLIALLILLIKHSSYFLGAFIFYINALFWHFWGYAGIAHEFFHKTVFSNRRLNQILYYFCSYITWNNPFYFSQSHRVHHSNTFGLNDTEVYSSPAFSRASIFWMLTFDLKKFYKKCIYIICNLVGFEPTFNKIFISKIKKIPKKNISIVLHSWAILLINLFYLTVIYLASNSILVTILVLITPFTATFFNVSLAVAQHGGLRQESVKGPLFYSRSIKLPRIIEFFYANMNFHAEHHFAPIIPYYNLPVFSSNFLNCFSREKIQSIGFLLSKTFAQILIKP